MKKFINKILPDRLMMRNRVEEPSFSRILQESDCLHINRNSVSKAVAIGLFFAFIPLPIQMLLSVMVSLYFRANIIIAVVMTWITNPITFIPLNYLIFSVGHYVTNNNETFHQIELLDIHSYHLTDIIFEILLWIKQIGVSFLVGLPIVAVGFSCTGYLLVQGAWRVYIICQVYKRRSRVSNKNHKKDQ